MNIKYLLLITIIASLVVSCGRSGNGMSAEKEMLKKKAVQYIKKSIKNPGSYDAIDFEIIPELGNDGTAVKYIIKHEYKAKDGIGTLRNEIDCFIYSKSEDVLLKDPSCVNYRKVFNRIVGEE